MIDPNSPQPPARPPVSARDLATGHSATEIASAAIAKAEPLLAHADALPVGTKLGEFEVLSLLGVGGFGMVYRAYDHSLHRTVAIKEYMPSAMAGRSQGLTMATRSSTDQQTLITGLRSFVSEARLLAQFDHPSLVKVYRFWEANNTAYMAMPLYRGVTLRQARLLLQRPPSEEWLRTVLWAILGALEYLHENNIVHRDVSPDNIFLQELGPPVLLDLGAARRTISETSHRHTAILKVNYAPIEQYAGAGDMRQGPWTDLYSVAAVVHGCLCNEPPLPATFRVLRDRMPTFTSVAKTVENHFGQTYSDEFVATVEHAMAIQPQNRPQSVQAFRDEMNLQPPEDIQHFAWAEGFSVFSTLAAAPADSAAEHATAERQKARTQTADMTPTQDTRFEPDRTILMAHPSVTHGPEQTPTPDTRFEPDNTIVMARPSATKEPQRAPIPDTGFEPDRTILMPHPSVSHVHDQAEFSATQVLAPESAKSLEELAPAAVASASKPNRWLFAGAVCVGLIGLGLWFAGSGDGSYMGSNDPGGTMASRTLPIPVPETGSGSETILPASPSPSAAASAPAVVTADATALATAMAASQAATAVAAPATAASAAVAVASAPLPAASAAQTATQNTASAAARRAAQAARLSSSAPSAPQTAATSTPSDSPAQTNNNPRIEPTSASAPARAPVATVATTPARASPQTACAEASFLTRPMCIFNECEKPEFTRLPFCVENRRRLVESQQRNQNQ